MNANDHDRALALAGLLQCCTQVQRIAQRGDWEETAATTGIYSLFQFDADSVSAVYGGHRSLIPGLQHLKRLLSNRVERTDMDITRYATALARLERRLRNRDDVMNTIQQGLAEIAAETGLDELTGQTLLSRIAELYVNTLSTIPPRIRVEGNREYLSQPRNIDHVRSLLFAGLRSAVLWRQCGGSRWTLLFGKRRLLNAVNEILEA